MALLDAEERCQYALTLPLTLARSLSRSLTLRLHIGALLTRYVFECYRPEPAVTPDIVQGTEGRRPSAITPSQSIPGPACLDGADAFLLQTLGDYAGAAAVAIRQRWEQVRTLTL